MDLSLLIPSICNHWICNVRSDWVMLKRLLGLRKPFFGWLRLIQNYSKLFLQLVLDRFTIFKGFMKFLWPKPSKQMIGLPNFLLVGKAFDPVFRAPPFGIWEFLTNFILFGRGGGHNFALGKIGFKKPTMNSHLEIHLYGSFRTYSFLEHFFETIIQFSFDAESRL